MDHPAQFNRGPCGGKPVTPTPIIQGWCPGALRPMMSGDGLVVRLRPRGGRLSGDQALGIAQLAQAHGNGLIDLSARANVQLRGVADAGHPVLIAGLAALGLIDETPKAEAARNIIVTPFWSAGDGTSGFADDLMAAICGPDFPELPGKFGYAVDTGATPVLRGASADIRIERCAAGLIVRADGAPSGAVVAPDGAIAAVADLVAWFLAMGGAADGRGRMADLIASGATLPDPFCAIAMDRGTQSPPKPGLVHAGALVGFQFGQMQAETLAGLARLGALRLTPWRMLVVEGAREMPALRGLITDPDDPMLRITACTGAPGCLQAHQPTRDLARDLARHMTHDLHISGCAKGCAHAHAAPVTLVATPRGYDLIRNGRASDEPVLRGLTGDEIRRHPETICKTPA